MPTFPMSKLQANINIIGSINKKTLKTYGLKLLYYLHYITLLYYIPIWNYWLIEYNGQSTVGYLF